MAINELQIISIETIYTLLIAITSLLVFFKTRKVYNFSNYKGLRYFSNAFLFIAVGFLLRYIIILQKILSGELLGTIQQTNLLLILMQFFLILPGMFLLYSLIWKKFENTKYSKKPLNAPVTFIYIVSLIFAIADFLLQSFLFMYLSQILLFLIASIIAYKNYKTTKQQLKQFYFISMVLFLIARTINLIAQYTIDSFPLMRIYTYIITVVVLFLFLYITNKLTKTTTPITLKEK